MALFSKIPLVPGFGIASPTAGAPSIFHSGFFVEQLWRSTVEKFEEVRRI